MKTILAAFAAILGFTTTATAVPTVTLEAFASSGAVVTEANMTHQTVYVSTATAFTMSGVNFGLRLVAKEGNLPISGTLNITTASYQRFHNGVFKVGSVLSKFNPSGDGSRPDMSVRNLAGTVVSTNNAFVAGSSTINANRFILEDMALPYNAVNFPRLSSPGDDSTVTFTVTGTFNGVAFTNTTASASVVLLDTPAVPTALALSGGPDNRVLSWIDVAHESGYIAEWTSDGLVWSTVGTVGANTVSLNIPWFKSCEARQFRVRATNPAGTSAPSPAIEMPGISSTSMVGGRLIVDIAHLSGVNLSTQIEVSADLANWGPPPSGTGFASGSGLSILRMTLPVMVGNCFVRMRSGQVNLNN